MYEEELIFGPLTLRQFASCMAAAAVAYFAVQKVAAPYSYLIAVIAILAGVQLVVRFKSRKISIGDLPTYLANGLSQPNPDAFLRFMQKKLAETQARIQIRKTKGMFADPVLESIAEILKKTLAGTHAG